VRRTEWPQERIANDLRRLTKGRGDFPSKAEFHEAGLRSLYDAICKYGGTARWAAQLGLSTSTSRQNRASR
jgi:hypothetical protein